MAIFGIDPPVPEEDPLLFREHVGLDRPQELRRRHPVQGSSRRRFRPLGPDPFRPPYPSTPDLFPRFVDPVRLPRRQVLQLGRLARGPGDRDRLGLRVRAEAEGQRAARPRRGSPWPGRAAGAGRTPPLSTATLAPIASRFEAVPVRSSRSQWLRVAAVVAEEAGGAAVGGEDDVEVAVAVDVGVGAAAADDRAEQVGAGGLGADEGEQRRRTSGRCSRRAGPTGRRSRDAWTLRDVALQVAVGREQVEPAVEVVVEEEEAELQRRLGRGAEAVDVGQVGELQPLRVVGRRRARSSRWRSCRSPGRASRRS